VKKLLKLALIFSGALAATSSLLGLVLFVVLRMEPSFILQKMNAEADLYIFPIVIFGEFYFFINDLLSHLTKRYQLHVGLDFSEIRFTYDLDNNNTLIPLRAKLWGLYPSSIALTSLGFVLVLFNR
jgi:hypothetical protein